MTKSLEKQIRNKTVIWYGPHACEKCGQMVVKQAKESGGLELDAEFEHHYPNYQWKKHKCHESTRKD